MARKNRVMFVAQCKGELIGHVYRSMLAASTTNRNSQIATVHFIVLGNPTLQERENIVIHRDEFRLRIEKVGDFFVLARESPQVGSPIRIG